MSNKRIDLWGFSWLEQARDIFNWEILHTNLEDSIELYLKYLSRTNDSGVAPICNYAVMDYMPEFVEACKTYKIKPLCGLKFKVKLPDDIKNSYIDIICYAEDEEGCEELRMLAARCNGEVLKYNDFKSFSNYLQIGLDLLSLEAMLNIENIIKYFITPDFVLIDRKLYRFNNWNDVLKQCDDNNILICATERQSEKVTGEKIQYSVSLSDEKMLEEFSLLGNRAYECVIENPRKIADRITGETKFDEKFIADEFNSRWDNTYEEDCFLNKRIDLSGTCHGGWWLAPNGRFCTGELYTDVLTFCEFDGINCLPRFAFECMKNNIKPLCGASFILETPQECLCDEVMIRCYAEDEDGCKELLRLYNRSDKAKIKYEDFCNFSNHLQVGLDLIWDERIMLIIDNVLEYVLVPDFVLINSENYIFRCWERTRKILEDRNILICGGELWGENDEPDEEVIKDFAAYGEKAYEYVIENPRKIADRITGDIYFNFYAIESIQFFKEAGLKIDYPFERIEY